MTQTANPVTLLASPLGEEGHEVAKGCTRVRMIMILDVDVTAERRHYNTHCPRGQSTTLGAKGPVKLKNPWAEGPSILRTFPFTTLLHNPPPSGGHNPRPEGPSTFPSEPFETSEPFEPSRRRRVPLSVKFYSVGEFFQKQ